MKAAEETEEVIVQGQCKTWWVYLSFAAHKLQLSQLLLCLESPLIQAWKSSGK